MASKEYFEEKSKLYYDSFLNNKSTRHVRGIIINDEGQVLLLYFKYLSGLWSANWNLHLKITLGLPIEFIFIYMILKFI